MSATPDDWRVAVHKGDVLSMTTTYDSKRASWYESMGIMVVWMAPNDTTGTDPFTTAVDVPGVLTHGHLPENDNHGGEPDPKHYEDMTKLPSKVLPSGTCCRSPTSCTQRRHERRARRSRRSRQGGSLTFSNDDADRQRHLAHDHRVQGAVRRQDRHRVPARRTAQPQFDSGELGTRTRRRAGSVTWSTPTNLPPGTYTYFCRIHPFMRGAFRVVAEVETRSACIPSAGWSSAWSSSWSSRAPASARGTCSATDAPAKPKLSTTRHGVAGGPATPDGQRGRSHRATTCTSATASPRCSAVT